MHALGSHLVRRELSARVADVRERPAAALLARRRATPPASHRRSPRAVPPRPLRGSERSLGPIAYKIGTSRCRRKTEFLARLADGRRTKTARRTAPRIQLAPLQVPTIDRRKTACRLGRARRTPGRPGGSSAVSERADDFPEHSRVKARAYRDARCAERNHDRVLGTARRGNDPHHPNPWLTLRSRDVARARPQATGPIHQRRRLEVAPFRELLRRPAARLPFPDPLRPLPLRLCHARRLRRASSTRKNGARAAGTYVFVYCLFEQSASSTVPHEDGGAKNRTLPLTGSASML